MTDPEFEAFLENLIAYCHRQREENARADTLIMWRVEAETGRQRVPVVRHRDLDPPSYRVKF